MNNWKSYCITSLLSLISILLSSNNYAHADLKSAQSFEVIKTLVEGFDNKGIEQTLIVMDDDDTLTMMQCNDQNSPSKCQYLGGPAWYSWQSELISNNSSSNFRVAEKNKELLQISALLLSINNMPYTDPIIPGVLRELTDKGSKVLVLTARGVSNLSASENQFDNLYLTEDKQQSFLSFLNSHALLGTNSGISSIAGPIKPASCNAERRIAYQQGVMYVAGQNKGVMLECLLARTDAKAIKNIVFIDDTLQNVKNVYNAFKDNEKYTVYAYHYTKLQAHKEALTQHKGKQNKNPYQVSANQRWLKISEVLKATLKQPTAIH
ncbi:uncharacterized protein DUF2608 [Sinobacterium caligoides]|uniref:Uncharacterized protein DUF2608 n=1 Tax=Sinobacterium caligoides TaxID=933926 RepID=A0A3N2DGU0_9GAMM|nr:DUF2608 domain-containing protein [Sinobacterium caligoides]ROR99010.1 uncharacterized protein DUF2608 [Sinobacterium caligoides]